MHTYSLGVNKNSTHFSRPPSKSSFANSTHTSKSCFAFSTARSKSYFAPTGPRINAASAPPGIHRWQRPHDHPTIPQSGGHVGLPGAFGAASGPGAIYNYLWPFGLQLAAFQSHDNYAILFWAIWESRVGPIWKMRGRTLNEIQIYLLLCPSST